MVEVRKKEIPPGTAAVIEGELVVSETQDSLCKIFPGENVTIIVDGIQIKDWTEVGNNNNVEIIPKKIPSKNQLVLKTSQDRMEAKLLVIKEKGKHYYLEDLEPARELEVKARQYEIIEPVNPSIEELKQFLKEKGITHGIDEDKLKDLADGTKDEVVVARGTPPQEGKDAELQILFDKKEVQKGESLIGNRPINVVEKGEVLAVKIPAIPGKAGVDVYGKEVSPPSVKDIILKAGPGVSLEDNGKKAVAQINGRAEQKGTTFFVLPIYTVEGDAAAQEGYINFNGDVVIKGNVMDGMKIHATGNIEIRGFAANCQLFAGKSITVLNSMISCEAKAGGTLLLYRKAKENLHEIIEQLLDLVNALKQLEKSILDANKNVPVGALLKMLLEKRYSKIPELLLSAKKVLIKLMKEGDETLKKPLAELISSIESWYNKTSGLKPLEIKKIGNLDYMLRALNIRSQNLLSKLDVGSEGAVIRSSYVQNSLLESSGDIIIEGKGCYNSQLVAGGSVKIKGSPGVFRGGHITAVGNVEVRELGSPAETKGFVQVGRESTIKADIVYQGIVVKAGNIIKKITEKEHNFKFGASV